MITFDFVQRSEIIIISSNIGSVMHNSPFYTILDPGVKWMYTGLKLQKGLHLVLGLILFSLPCFCHLLH